MKSAISLLIIFMTLILSGCVSTDDKQKAKDESVIVTIVEALLEKAKGAKKKSQEVWGSEVGSVVSSETMQYMKTQEMALQKALVGSGVTIQRDFENVEIILPGHVTFGLNSASVNQSFKPVLGKIAQVVNQYKKTTLMIEGHTDADGTEKYNLALSERRAASIRDALKQQKVHESRMITLGMGEYQPIADNETAKGKQTNRRVEIVIQPIEK